jgi:hypothetical protein
VSPRRRAWALAALLAPGLALAQAVSSTEGVTWLRAPATADVAWRGMLATEGGAVGSGTQIGPYVVPGPAGLLAAIFTHAAIQGSVTASIRKREQEEADRVLEPYRAALQAWPAAALWQAALAGAAPEPPLRLWDGQGSAPAGPLIEAAPLFTMAQDEAVLVLDLVVRRSAAGKEVQEGVVRVVSSPLPGTAAIPLAPAAPASAASAAAADPAASAASAAAPAPPPQRLHWAGSEAQALKRTAAAMLAHALHLAQRHAGPDDETVPMRTHRYLQGTLQRAERARQIASTCNRAVLRTLRGALMSVPVAPGPDCNASTPF